MTTAPVTEVARCVRSKVRDRNRQLAFEAAVEVVLGVLFAALTLAFVFWITWLFGGGLARMAGLAGWHLALIITGLFLIVTTVSAWRQVDPLAGVDPMTAAEEMLTGASLASPEMLYFSPRHATAGAAMLLLGGPANVFTAVGTWRHRLPGDTTVITDAATLLCRCGTGLAVERITTPRAAVLLARLALIKVVPKGASGIIEPTENGRSALGAV